MDLPIDWDRPRPIREKYLDEETELLAIWYVFGQHPTTGHVDIASPFGDVFTNVPPAAAQKIIDARDKFVREVIEIVNA